MSDPSVQSSLNRPGIGPAPVYDAENDRFLRPLVCPYARCATPCPIAPERSPEVVTCPACLRPYELITLTGEFEDVGGVNLWTARRPHSSHCTRTGRPLTGGSVLDWGQAGGGPSRNNTQYDPAGQLFGRPTRDVEWTLAGQWQTDRWGHADRPRPSEPVTSVSVHRGVVVAVSAKGRIGLFRPDDGAPLLSHPLEWPGAETDDTLRQAAVRHPVALFDQAACLLTERRALFRDLSSSLFTAAAPSERSRVRVEPSASFVGAPLVIPPSLGSDGATFVLLDARPVGPDQPLQEANLVFFDRSGQQKRRVTASDVVRPPVFDPVTGQLIWVSHLGHVFALAAGEVTGAATSAAGQRTASEVRHFLPSTMLSLRTTERPLLAVAVNNAGRPELWLADDQRSEVRVWRAALDRVLQGGEWNWEPVFEDEDLGSLRHLAVGIGSGAEGNRAGSVFALSTDRSTAVFTRAMQTRDAEAVLPREAIAPPVLTHVGVLLQDSQGLWLRGFEPWSFREDNPERLYVPPVAPVRAGFFDQTLAVLGRQAFFAVGGTICAANFAASPRAK